MFRPILIPAIVHGITDIVDAPVESIFTYALVCPLVYHFPLPVKTTLLLIGSVYHLRHDVPYGLKGNILMHLLWIQQPIIAELYLSFVHTPRHYYRTLLDTYNFKIKLLWVGLMSLIVIADMIFKYSHRLGFLGSVPLWWVGPVLCHIYMTDFYIPSINHKL
jgi:hypothetical protein